MIESREYLRKIGSIMAEKDINIVLRKDGFSGIENDRQTIHIPTDEFYNPIGDSIPLEKILKRNKMKPEQIKALRLLLQRSVLYSQAGRILYTPDEYFDLVNKGRWRPEPIKQAYNFFEDFRIEKKLGNQYPKFNRNFGLARRASLAMLDEYLPLLKALEHISPQMAMNVALAQGALKHEKMRKFNPNKVTDCVAKWINKIIESPDDAHLPMKAATEIFKMIYTENQQPDVHDEGQTPSKEEGEDKCENKESPSGEGDKKEKSEKGEGDGKGQGKSEKNKDKKEGEGQSPGGGDEHLQREVEKEARRKREIEATEGEQPPAEEEGFGTECGAGGGPNLNPDAREIEIMMSELAIDETKLSPNDPYINRAIVPKLVDKLRRIKGAKRSYNEQLDQSGYGIDIEALVQAKTMDSPGDYSKFYIDSMKDRVEYNIVMCIDASGSMQARTGGAMSEDRLALAKKTACTIGKALDALEIKYNVLQCRHHETYSVKAFEQTVDESKIYAVTAPSGGCEIYWECFEETDRLLSRLRKSTGTKKEALLFISDGWDESDTDHLDRSFRGLSMLKKQGIKTAYIGMGMNAQPIQRGYQRKYDFDFNCNCSEDGHDLMDTVMEFVEWFIKQ